MKNLLHLLPACDDASLYRIQGTPLCHNERLWQGEQPGSLQSYLVLSYRAENLERRAMLRQPVILAAAGQETIGLIHIHDLIADGANHRVIVPADISGFDHLSVALSTRFPSALLEISELYTCEAGELPFRFIPTQPQEGYCPLDIAAYCNDVLPADPGTVDSGVGIPKGTLALQGIPFAFADGKMIRPADDPAENEEPVVNFGVPTTRRVCRPVSKESRIELPVNCSAAELLFCLYMDGNTYERYGFCAPDPTILGSANGEVLMPLQINDIERYSVQVVYTDGFVDECFPENLATHKHVISGEVGVYGVRTLPEKIIEKIVFENRTLRTDISVLAVTANLSAPCVTADFFASRVKRPAPAKDFGKEMTLNGSTLTVKNGSFFAEFDLSDGFTLVKAASGYDEAFTLSCRMLKIRQGEQRIDRFCFAEAAVTGNTARIAYSFNQLRLTVVVENSCENGIELSLQAENRGEETRFGILFPVLENLQLENSQNTWYFLPKYQNTESNASCYVYEESAPSYPMQFMDIFNPTAGWGIALNTFERDLKVRKYALIKQEGKVQAFVEYPEMYGRLAKDGATVTSKTRVSFHEGDWHKPWLLYKSWLDSWYEPYHCQDKKWYRQLFWLIAEITDFAERSDFYKIPVWYVDGKYHYSEIMQEVQSIYGEKPDILHMWGWTASPGENEAQHWGNYNTEDYNRIGGLEKWTAELKRFKQETGAEISLYLHPTLLSDCYPHFNRYFPKYAVENAAGNHIDLFGHHFRMCHANREWRNFVLDIYPRVYQETGIRLLYVDEFSLRVENRCYAEGHGHEVPSNLLKTDRTVITELKDRMPDEVVLYGEYYPVDVNARYIDCNISYYILDSINEMIEQGVHGSDGDDSFCRVFTDLYRFAFPKIVQLILPMAMRSLTWQPLKATFFNGEAIYDSFWDAEESRGVKYMARAYRLKKQYADCFACDHPETMVETLSDAICANRYPGETRCVYTLFNRGHHTYQGEVLCLPTVPGAQYRDIWNDVPLSTREQDCKTYLIHRITAHNTAAIAIIYPDK